MGEFINRTDQINREPFDKLFLAHHVNLKIFGYVQYT